MGASAFRTFLRVNRLLMFSPKGFLDQTSIYMLASCVSSIFTSQLEGGVELVGLAHGEIMGDVLNIFHFLSHCIIIFIPLLSFFISELLSTNIPYASYYLIRTTIVRSVQCHRFFTCSCSVAALGVAWVLPPPQFCYSVSLTDVFREPSNFLSFHNYGKLFI